MSGRVWVMKHEGLAAVLASALRHCQILYDMPATSPPHPLPAPLQGARLGPAARQAAVGPPHAQRRGRGYASK